MNVKDGNNRIEYFDLLRVLALFGVIAVHAEVSCWNFTSSDFNWHVFIVYDAMFRWTVPIFMMISGTLFLRCDKDLRTLYQKNILRVVTAFVFWSALYAILQNKNGSRKTMVFDFLTGYYHLWFCLMIAGLYMLTPFIRKIVVDRKIRRYFLILSFLFVFLIPEISRTLLRTQNEYIHILADSLNHVVKDMHVDFVGGYVFYYILGYELHECDIKRGWRYAIYLSAISGYITTVLMTIKMSGTTGVLDETYFAFHSINVMLMAVGVFVFAKYHFRSNRVLRRLSKYGFGAYLVHVLLIERLSDELGINALSFQPVISVPVIAVLIYISSNLISALLNHIPVINKYIV